MKEQKGEHVDIKRDTDLFETIFITILVGIVGSVFIAGTFVWQEIELEKQLNKTIYVSSGIK
ncbi:hypothetical protein C0580_04995 [Candidatus Parcubacteria bacterium]|nr:MAG: hypothetical protein C0580_04995 [Candidatus Parcubacteria bacterium]